MAQSTNSGTDIEKRYGEFYAVQEADLRTELEIESTLLNTTGRIYMEPDLSTAKLAAVGALESAKNFLLKYKDVIPEQVMSDLETTIIILRTTELDREGINLIYQPIREEIVETLGITLGFRKQRVMKYKWTQKLVDRMQLPDTPQLKKILEKKNPKSGSSVK